MLSQIFFPEAYVLRVWNVKFMPRTKKNCKLDIYYYFFNPNMAF